MAAEKRSISLPDDLYKAALARCKRMGYGSFSEYITYLVRNDLRDRPHHIREEPEPRPRKGTGPDRQG